MVPGETCSACCGETVVPGVPPQPRAPLTAPPSAPPVAAATAAGPSADINWLRTAAFCAGLAWLNSVLTIWPSGGVWLDDIAWANPSASTLVGTALAT